MTDIKQIRRVGIVEILLSYIIFWLTSNEDDDDTGVHVWLLTLLYVFAQ